MPKFIRSKPDLDFLQDLFLLPSATQKEYACENSYELLYLSKEVISGNHFIAQFRC
ncbi:MAG: hypothetical protein HKN13_09445 [Rhodothermales bacterium]|nr:hypothetical protein [Rhodothermales bacterium]